MAAAALSARVAGPPTRREARLSHGTGPGVTPNVRAAARARPAPPAPPRAASPSSARPSWRSGRPPRSASSRPTPGASGTRPSRRSRRSVTPAPVVDTGGPACRSPLTTTDPLRLWIGGDSLAGSLGPALGTLTAATGVVAPVFDSRGLERPLHAGVLRLAEAGGRGPREVQPRGRGLHHRGERLDGAPAPTGRRKRSDPRGRRRTPRW